jgi:ligand-binding sensor domain-containing protein/signal transduction histidine kinase
LDESDSSITIENILSNGQSAPTGQVRFETVTDQDGLPLDSPYSITQDRLGFLWIGTSKGLIRYDGYSVKRYEHNPDDLNSLSNNKVFVVTEDQMGALWVGTYGGGLNRFDRDLDRFVQYRYNEDDPNSLSDDRVTALYVSRAGVLWVGTFGGGLNRFDRETAEFLRYSHDSANPSSLSSHQVNVIHAGSNGVLWIGTDAGLDKLNPQTGKFVHYRHESDDPRSLSDGEVTAIFEDSFGIIWVGTSGGGLDRFDLQKERFDHFRHNPRNPYTISEGIVYSILEDQHATLWIGTMGGGISRFDRGTERFVRYLHDPLDTNSLSSNYINAMYEDTTGTLWIGTTLLLNKYDPNKEKFSQLFSRDHISAITEDRSGKLWIGTFDGLYSYDDEIDQVYHYRHQAGNTFSLSEWWVSAIVEDRSGGLWVGTAGGGLNFFDQVTERFTHYKHNSSNPYSLNNDVVNTLYLDSHGLLWVGTDNGVNTLDRGSGRFYDLHILSTIDEPAGAEIVTAMLEDGGGSMWFGTQGGGLKQYDPENETLRNYRHHPDQPLGLMNDVINVLFEDSNGRLWIGTEGGLHQFDRETGIFLYYGLEDGLPDDEIHAILEDQSGYLWLSTDHGLSKFDPDTGVFRNYDMGDGLQANQFSGAAYQRRDGEMLFGGINGISAFYPAQISDNPHPPPLVLLSLKQEGEEIALDQAVETVSEITLSGLKDDFEFEFAALSYSQPEKNQHAYMLAGYDQDWNYIGTERIGRYSNLPGGVYTLRLIGANDDGVWNDVGHSIRVTVEPPFWETWWFRGLLGLVIVGGVFASYRVRVKSIQARSQELEVLVEHRTHEIDQRQQELEALYHAEEKMHRYLQLEQVLQALVDVSVDILHADKSAVFVWDHRSHCLVARVVRGFDPQRIAQLSSTQDNGLIRQVASSGEPVVVEDTLAISQGDSDGGGSIGIVLEEGVRSFMYLPIPFSGGVFSVFSVCFTRPHAFGLDEQRLFTALAQRAALSIENARLYEDAQRLAILEERGRLARDLHDSAKQNAFAALAQLGIATELVIDAPQSAQGHLMIAENLVQDVLQELMTLIQEMHPAELKERGLVPLVREYTYGWGEGNNIELALQLEENGRLPLEVEQALYRVTQEALSNISRHAGAHKVGITLTSDHDFTRLIIYDDGSGFDPSTTSHGFGLRSMRERVEALEGIFQIDSAPKLGTAIVVEIPLQAQFDSVTGESVLIS